MHNKRILLGVLCVCVFFNTAFGQSNEDWYYGKEIQDIEFIGLESVNTLDLDSIVSPFLGQLFSDEIYAEILNRIYALEYFDDISPSAIPADPELQSVILQFTVVERPIVTNLVFLGNSQIRTAELRDATFVKENDIYISSKVVLDERSIRDLYFQKGYTNAKIFSEIEENDDGVYITFTIDEGRSTVISEINFQGNTIASAQTLKKELLLKEVSLFQKGAFQEAALEQDRSVIQLFYVNKGYIDILIEDIVQEITYNEEKNRDEMILTYIINEGAQYLFDGIVFQGNVVFTTEELENLIRLKKGDVYDQTRFQEGLAAVADLYLENGYTSNEFYPVPTKDVESRTISWIFDIIEQRRSHIGNIRIVGNDKTKDYIILREIPLETGDVYSNRKLRTGYRSLLNLGFFSAVVPELVSGSEQNLVDIIINVEEQSTINLEFGVSFSGVTDAKDFPVSLFLRYGDSNFLGTGKSISTDIVGSTDEQSISFNYGDSWFLGLPLTFNAGFFVRHLATTTLYNNYLPTGVNNTDYYMDYNQLSFGINLAFGKRWVWDFATLTTTGGLSNNFLINFYDADLYEPIDITVSDKHGKIGLENSISVSTSLDARDIIFDPSVGWFLSQRFSWTGLIPKIESEYFLRSDTKGELYFTLIDQPVSETWNFKLVFATYSGLSFLLPAYDSPISSINDLDIDGIFNGRGWGQSSRDQSYNVSGHAQWSSYVELRMPIAPGIFSVDFFMDAIAIKETPKEIFTSLKLDDFYFSFGPGARFSIPQFPLRLLWAWSFKFDNGQLKWNSVNKNLGAFVLSFNLTNR